MSIRETERWKKIHEPLRGVEFLPETSMAIADAIFNATDPTLLAAALASVMCKPAPPRHDPEAVEVNRAEMQAATDYFFEHWPDTKYHEPLRTLFAAYRRLRPEVKP